MFKQGVTIVTRGSGSAIAVNSSKPYGKEQIIAVKNPPPGFVVSEMAFGASCEGGYGTSQLKSAGVDMPR
jgi:hypothetical protein